MSERELFFSEAMEIAKSEPVVVLGDNGCTSRPMEMRDGILYFADDGAARRMELVPFKVEYLTRRWRCARPQRSRAQEMVDEYARAHNSAPQSRAVREVTEVVEQAIRAVCEYLRAECQHGEDSSSEYASVIERHFLEPQ